MSGMAPGLDSANPTLVAAFRSALLHQLGIIVLIFAALLACWAVRNRFAGSAPRRPRPAAAAEPMARRLLRTGFGILWLVDGILQAQPRMAGGLTSQVIEPAAAASPRWVQDIVNSGGTIWSFHPVQAAASTVWIQAGLGLWLIAAEAGWWSRLAGLASAAWGMIVWVFGEAIGGVFAPGLSWLSGAPGAVVIYVAAGVLIALPLRAWAGPRLGRAVLAVTGLLWAGLAVLQAWPGRGYWQGQRGTLTGMIRSMAQVSQPRPQATLVSAVASFTAAHGFAVNLVTVAVLGLLGLALMSGQPRLLRAAVPAATAFCLVVWVLVQDFGVPGGLGTDPNSMVPWVLLLWGGYLAVTQEFRVPAHAIRPGEGQPAPSPVRTRPRLVPVRWAGLRHVPLRSGPLRPAALRQALASARASSVTAAGAAAVVLVGTAPMVAAAVNQNADPIIAQAIAGGAVQLGRPAPGFQLTSQSGRPVSLVSLRGRALLLTFLDPVCAGCSVIAQELKAASALLGPASHDVELVAIAADSTHFGTVFTRAFDQHEGLTAVPNWLFLTGTLGQLHQVWTRYEQIAPHMMTGMSVRSDITFVIDPNGWIRQEVGDAPGPGTTSTRSSFALLLSSAARQALALKG